MSFLPHQGPARRRAVPPRPLSALLAALVLQALAACGIVETAGGGTDDPNGLTARIAGTAVGPDSIPERAVAILGRVVLDAQGDQVVLLDSVRTDAAGAFLFERVAEGRYFVETRSLDGRNVAFLAHIDRIGRADVGLGLIAMAPPAILEGRLDLPDHIASGGTIAVAGTDRVAAIGADGAYRLDSVPPGEIDLVFRLGRIVNVLPLRLRAETRTAPIAVAPVALRSPFGGVAPPEAAVGLPATYVAPAQAPIVDGVGVTYLAPGIAGGKNDLPVLEPWVAGGGARHLQSGTLRVADGQMLLATGDTLLPLDGLSAFGSFQDGQILLLDLLRTVDGAKVFGVIQASEIGVILDTAAIVEELPPVEAFVESLRPKLEFAPVEGFQARRSGSGELVIGFRHAACADTIIPRLWWIGPAPSVADGGIMPPREMGVGIHILARSPCTQAVTTRWSSLRVGVPGLPVEPFVLVHDPGGARIAMPGADAFPTALLWDFEEAGMSPFIGVSVNDSAFDVKAERVPGSSGTVLGVFHAGGIPRATFRVLLQDSLGFGASTIPYALELRARASRPVSVRIVVESAHRGYQSTRFTGGAHLGATVDVPPSQDSGGAFHAVRVPFELLASDSADSVAAGSWSAERESVLRAMTGISLVVDDPGSKEALSVELDDIRFVQ